MTPGTIQPQLRISMRSSLLATRYPCQRTPLVKGNAEWTCFPGNSSHPVAYSFSGNAQKSSPVRLLPDRDCAVTRCKEVQISFSNRTYRDRNSAGSEDDFKLPTGQSGLHRNPLKGFAAKHIRETDWGAQIQKCSVTENITNEHPWRTSWGDCTSDFHASESIIFSTIFNQPTPAAHDHAAHGHSREFVSA